jgi:hypothetical protein
MVDDNANESLEESVEETPEEEVEEEETPEEEVEEEPEEPDEEPPVRKSAKDYIIERKNKKIEKLQAEEEPDDIRSIIRNELDPIKESFAKTKDEEELQSALQKYPESKKLEKTVRKYMENDAYSKIPVEFIVRGLLAGRETKKKEADAKASATRQGGHTKRPKEVKEKSAWDMTEEEFQKLVSEVMSTRKD